MIQAQDLRIGNYLQNCGHYCIVESIEKDGAMLTFLHYVEGMYNDMPYTPEGIPLTEEILLKAGFFKYNNAYVLETPTENIMEFKFTIWEDFTYNSSEFRIKLETLHQLQNLYFALTGEELKITL